MNGPWFPPSHAPEVARSLRLSRGEIEQRVTRAMSRRTGGWNLDRPLEVPPHIRRAVADALDAFEAAGTVPQALHRCADWRTKHRDSLGRDQAVLFLVLTLVSFGGPVLDTSGLALPGLGEWTGHVASGAAAWAALDLGIGRRGAPLEAKNAVIEQAERLWRGDETKPQDKLPS